MEKSLVVQVGESRSIVPFAINNPGLAKAYKGNNSISLATFIPVPVSFYQQKMDSSST